MDNKARTALTVAALSVALQGCRILQTVSPGGSVVSASGQYDCAEDSVCEIDVPNDERFAETFTAIPRHGYAFAGWRAAERYLCAGASPLCVVDIPASVTAYDALGYMTAEFYHQPELLYPGTLGGDSLVWSGEVTYDDISFNYVADFDADGDDDVFLGAGTAGSETFEGARTGAILINQGGYSFTAAAGDPPSGVHPREFVMADFDGDGHNDFFIADHGHDTEPFPGWSNQLLLWTAEGYDDASDRLPPDDSGFTHSAAAGDVDGDGDIDILVGNTKGDYIEGPYLLLNDGSAQFTENTDRLPDRVRADSDHWPNAAELADLDGDGHVDLIAGSQGGSTNESFVYWGADDGEFRDENVTELSAPEFFHALGNFNVISIAVRDIDGDERPDIVLGGYDDDLHRGMQVQINRGGRSFEDQTRRRIGHSAWSSTEEWHDGAVFLDFNGDGTEDIVPQGYAPNADNVLAWLNDGTGHYVALKTTLYANDTDAGRWLFNFAAGVIVREGAGFRTLQFHSPDEGVRRTIVANAAWVAANPVITLAE